MDKKKILKCKYQNCKEEAFFRHTLNLIDGDDDSVELDFCKYHFFIVMGGHFKVKAGELVGPIEEIGVIEQVIAAREMILAEKTKA